MTCFLTELEKLDLYTLNASRTERFFAKRPAGKVSSGLVQKCGKCERTAPTRLPRGKVSQGSGQIRGTKPTAMSKSKCAKSCALRSPPLPLRPPPTHPPKGERGERTGEERKIFPPFSVRLLHFFACVLYSHPAPVCVEPLGHG